MERKLRELLEARERLNQEEAEAAQNLAALERKRVAGIRTLAENGNASDADDGDGGAANGGMDE